MQMNDMIIISVDDHIIEPPDLFSRNMPAKFKDSAPRVARYADGQERWILDGARLCSIAPAAVAGRKREEMGFEPSRYGEVRKGAYDVHARVEDMNANGVLASLNFANVLGFAGEKILHCRNRDLALAIVQVYNDWHCEQWAGAYPGRFIPVALLPLWDVSLAVTELQRVAKKGMRVFSFPENPPTYGLPSIHGGAWDPLFKAAVDNDIAVVIHIGTSGGELSSPSPSSPAIVGAALLNIKIADSLADLVFSPLPKKFPSLRIALSEGCMGWLPYMRQRMEEVYATQAGWSGHDFGKDTPTSIIARHFLFCFHEDDFGLRQRHEIGIDQISVEVDYPHSDATWPKTPERLWRSVKDFPEDEIHKITHRNAMRFFDFDPFRFVQPQEATVGALRAQAAHVDVTPKSLGGRAPQKTGHVVSSADISKMLKNMDESLGEPVGML